MEYFAYFLLWVAGILTAIAIPIAILRWVLRINTAINALKFMCNELEKVNENLSNLNHGFNGKE